MKPVATSKASVRSSSEDSSRWASSPRVAARIPGMARASKSTASAVAVPLSASRRERTTSSPPTSRVTSLDRRV